MKTLFKTKNKARKQTEIQSGLTSPAPARRHCLGRPLISAFTETKVRSAAREEMVGGRKEKKGRKVWGKTRLKM